MTNFATKLSNLLSFNESVTILSFKDDGVLESLLENISGQKLEFIDAKLIIDFEELNKELVYVVENIDQSKDLEELFSIIDAQKNIKFIFSISDVNTFKNLELILPITSKFFNNIIITSTSDYPKKENLISMSKEKYGVIESESKLEKIYNLSGGHKGIYTALYKSEILGIDQIANNYLKKLALTFSESELVVLRKIIKKIETNDEELKLIGNYIKLSIVENNKLMIPALKQTILDMTPREKIEYAKDGQIIFNNIHEFSKTEIKSLKTLVENESEIVTKEELGYVVWGKEVDEKYSPWAIDQIIFRLRSKLEKLNIYGEIKTIHGKGYVFQG